MNQPTRQLHVATPGSTGNTHMYMIYPFPVTSNCRLVGLNKESSLSPVQSPVLSLTTLLLTTILSPDDGKDHTVSAGRCCSGYSQGR